MTDSSTPKKGKDQSNPFLEDLNQVDADNPFLSNRQKVGDVNSSRTLPRTPPRTPPRLNIQETKHRRQPSSEAKGSLQVAGIIDGLFAEIPSAQDEPNHFPTTSTSSVPFENIRALREKLARARGELKAAEQKAASKAEDLKSQISAHEEEQLRREAAACGGATTSTGVVGYESSQQQQQHPEGLQHRFTALDQRLAKLRLIAAQVGDRLNAAESHRRRALDALSLIGDIEHFAADNYPENLPDLFKVPSRVAEAGPRVQQVRGMAVDLLTHLRQVSGNTTSQSVGVSHLEVAVENLQDYCNDLEVRQLDIFNRAAKGANKISRGVMRECVLALEAFNGAGSVVRGWLNSRPMFINPQHLQGGTRLPSLPGSGPETPLAAAEAAANQGEATVLGALRQLFQDVEEEVRVEVGTIRDVFVHSPEEVAAQLIQRVMEQRVQLAVECVLPRLPVSPSPSGPGLVPRLAHLRTLQGAHAATHLLAQRLGSLGCGSLDCASLADGLFALLREDVLAHQLEVQRMVFHTLLEEYPPLQAIKSLQNEEVERLRSRDARRRWGLVRQVSSMPGDTDPITSSTSAAAEEGGGGGGGVGPSASPSSWLGGASSSSSSSAGSLEVTGALVRGAQEGMERCCALLTLQPQTAATAVLQVYGNAVSAVESYLSEVCEAVSLRLSEESKDRTLTPESTDKAPNTPESKQVEGLRLALCVTRATSQAVERLHACAQTQELSWDLRLPSQTRELVEGCSALLQAAQPKLEANLVEVLGYGVEWEVAEVARVLAKKQQVGDYNPPDEESPSSDQRPSPATQAAIHIMQSAQAAAEDVLQGENLRAVLRHLADGVYRSVRQHLLCFQFSPPGGLQLKWDLTELACVIGCLGHQSKVVEDRFIQLKGLANLFIVHPDSLPGMLDDSLQMSREEFLKILALRTDYHSAKIASLFSSNVDVLPFFRF